MLLHALQQLAAFQRSRTDAVGEKFLNHFSQGERMEKYIDIKIVASVCSTITLSYMKSQTHKFRKLELSILKMDLHLKV